MEIRLSWALIALALLILGCEGRDVRRTKRQLNEDESDPTEREAKKLLVDGFIVSNKKRVTEGQPHRDQWVGRLSHAQVVKE